ncbi:MAG: 1-phosphofructokinase family hexose kinase [Anaerolineales bacterium]
MILCVTPNPALDRILTAPGYRTEDVVRVRQSVALAGGKGNNVARAIRTLSPRTPVVCAGFLGGSTGRAVAALAERDGFEAAWTWIEGETRTCTILVDPEARVSTAVNEPGPDVTVEAWACLHTDVLRAAQSADWICISGSLPPGSPLNAFSQLIHTLTALQRPVLVDTSGPALLAALDARPTAIKINAHEAGALLGQAGDDIPSVTQMAQSLVRRYALKFVALTLAAKGAVWVTENRCWQATPPVIEATNTVASGDAFFAGMVTALSAGAAPEQALRSAVAAGAANALARGGARFQLNDYEAWLRETQSTSRSC